MTDYIEQGNRVVVIGSCAWTNKKTRKRVDTPKIDVWRFRNGKAVEFSGIYDTAKVFEGLRP